MDTEEDFVSTDKNRKKDRRKFIVEGAAGLAGLTILPSMLKAQAEEKTEQPKKNPKIVYRTFGKSGVKMPVVSVGAGACENPEIIRVALDAGIIHLDTANSYSRGRNEEMIGEVIKGRPRDSFFISTKVVGEAMDMKSGLFTKETTAGPFVEKFETSLKRLDLEYVDILMIHSLVKREAVLFEPLLSALVKLKEQGKTKLIGVSTHSNEPEVVDAVVESKVYDAVLTAYNFRQPHRAQLEASMERAAKAGVGIVAMKTQAGVYWDRERQKMINMAAALKWALRKEYVHTAIPGMASFDHLTAAMSVMENLALTSQEKADLESGEKLGMSGLYCRQCRQCVAQCPHGVEIPALMRSYMYAYGYRNLSKASETCREIVAKGIACEECGSCTVGCTMGFDVKQRAVDIARIRNVPQDFLG